MDQPKPGDHVAYMHLALEEAKKSPPKPSNFCVGAILVDTATNTILSTGYTLELEGNTHAEQCAIEKYAESQGVPVIEVGDSLPEHAAIYTTMEPCNKRSIGNLPCVDRILLARSSDHKKGIQTVYLGVLEPQKFVGENVGRTRLENAGVECVHVPGLEDEILGVATAGHEK
jgi:pyrimidine deaminase RibD-like protein